MKNLSQILKNNKYDTSSMPKVNVAVLGDTATQILCSAIKGLGIEKSINVVIYEADYNQVERQLLDEDSELHEISPEYVIIFQSTHKLCNFHSKSTLPQQQSLSDDRISFIDSVCKSEWFANKKIIYFNYPEIDDTVFGNYTNKVKESFTFQVRKLNYELMILAQKLPNLYICDIASIQNKIGRDVMYPANMYMSSEMVLSIKAIPMVASRVIDIISALRGNFKKCLILDLDNTLWGGVVGDDGWEGIQLGHGLGIGKAFVEFQQWVKKLKNRGVIICVASKNDEEKAKEPFTKHPDMVLRLEDIAVFMANWETKVDNIKAIQEILNISFDSMVFIDDNPFERAIVRENIKGITVPEMPEDPAEYLEFLYGENLFETVSYSSADKDRTKQYRIEAERVNVKKSFKNEKEFLKSLDMVSSVSNFTKFHIPRVAQLTQRSNQFNLRTVRYTESEIENIAHDKDHIGLCFMLKDRFGDNGLIAVVILKKVDKATLFIDTWLMSCRVLKRSVENFTLNTIVEVARENGYSKIIGEYIPTPKNKIVSEHYLNLGFTELGNNRYELDINDYINKECYIIKN